MEVTDKRTRKPRRALFEVGPGEVVQLDDCGGFWMKRIYESDDSCSLVSIGTGGGVMIFASRNTIVTLVKTTMTIEDGIY